MKKLVTLALVLGGLISGSTLIANNDMDRPSLKPANNMQVSFDNVSSDATLYIKDRQGMILYTEDIDSEGRYKRAFDVSEFPSDEYYFEIDNKAFISIYPFTVAAGFVQFEEASNTMIVKPVLLAENNRVKLMRNLDQEQSIDVEIYYRGQKLVYSENIDRDGMINRIYDFSGSASGDYLFSIKYDDRQYDEYLSINTTY